MYNNSKICTITAAWNLVKPSYFPILWQSWSWTLLQTVSHANFYILSWWVKNWNSKHSYKTPFFLKVFIFGWKPPCTMPEINAKARFSLRHRWNFICGGKRTRNASIAQGPIVQAGRNHICTAHGWIDEKMPRSKAVTTQTSSTNLSHEHENSHKSAHACQSTHVHDNIHMSMASTHEWEPCVHLANALWLGELTSKPHMNMTNHN